MDDATYVRQLSDNKSEVFPLICEVMRHSKVDEGRQFLCAINNIIDIVSASRPNCDNGINVHVINIPMCPEWARELLVRFLLHKVALTQDSSLLASAKREISRPLVMPPNTSGTSRIGKKLQEERKFYRQIVKLFSSVLASETQSKTLFVVPENDVITRNEDKNPVLSILYGRDILSKKAAIVSSDLSGYDLEEKLDTMEQEDTPTIETIFIFNTPNKGKLTNSYNVDQIDRLNQYGLGVGNVFVMNISEKPFRLYHTIDNIKYRICSGLLNKNVTSYDAFNGFITFTSEESDILFNRPNRQFGCIIDTPEREYFTVELDAVFDQLPHNYRYKNELLLALSADVQAHIKKELKEEAGYVPEDVLDAFFSYYPSIFKDNIVPKIESFIGESNFVTFILPANCRWAKPVISQLFYAKDRAIDFKGIDDLKAGIKSPKIVFLPYRYTDTNYKSYPNSYDPLPIGNNQEVFTLINRLTHNGDYEWNKHFYDKDLNGLLYSDFRAQYCGWKRKSYHRPSFPEVWRSNIEEAEQESRDYSADTCTVVYENGRGREYLASSKALYESNGYYEVSSLKDLSGREIKKILVLDELVEFIKSSLVSKNKDNPRAEEYIRRDEKYGLSQSEITSKIELWKFLLKRKVDEFGIGKVYEDMFHGQADISISGFQHWFDYEYPMILPRSKKSQYALLTYLGFSIGSPYHRIVVMKKLLSINDTRRLNAQIESFLSSALTISDITEDDFDQIKEDHSDILLTLDVNSLSDMRALIDLLDITLKCIKEIIYDKD